MAKSPTVQHINNRRWRRANPARVDGSNLPVPIAEHILVAPPVLDFGAEVMNPLYRFFGELRFRALVLKQRVVIDLRYCTRVGPVGVLLLAAEITRCNHARPDAVTGYSPTDPIALATLSTFGFFEACGLEVEQPMGPRPGFYQIQTGVGQTADLSAKLGEVAALTLELWADQAFTDRIHGALNEAMTNVIMHAYDPELLEHADACESGRWWVAGMADKDLDYAWFMALDLGVGMPVSAPAKNKFLRTYLNAPEQLTDEVIIWLLVAQEGRSRTGLPQHGKGLPTMVSVIKDRVDQGTLWIVSGLGVYILDKNPARQHRHTMEIRHKLKAKSSGTLILWKVGRPTMSPIRES